MTETFRAEELDHLIVDAIEPVQPPAFVRSRILAAIAAIPQNSETIRASEGRWIDLPHPGVRIKKLSEERRRGTVTFLMSLAPGASVPSHGHRGAEDTYVVAGSCRVGEVALFLGDFHHIDAGEKHGTVVTDGGCTLLLVVDERDYRAA